MPHHDARVGVLLIRHAWHHEEDARFAAQTADVLSRDGEVLRNEVQPRLA